MVLMWEVKSASCSWLKRPSYSRMGVDHSFRTVPIAFHLDSVKMKWVLVENNRTVISKIKRRGRPIIIITVVTNPTDQSRIEIAVCYIIYK